jgi:hypothetical protein
MERMVLSEYSTKELYEELFKREGIREILDALGGGK